MSLGDLIQSMTKKVGEKEQTASPLYKKKVLPTNCIFTEIANLSAGGAHNIMKPFTVHRTFTEIAHSLAGGAFVKA